MGVRAIRARVECDHDTLMAIWRTHCVFNQRLPSLITKLFAMRRGEVGDDPSQRRLYQQAMKFILARDAKDAPYLLNSVSIKGWKPSTAIKMTATVTESDGQSQMTGDAWAVEAAELSARGVLAYDKEKERDGLPDSLFQPLIREAVACISGHDELVRNWRNSHAEWVRKRADWEATDEHRRYLALRPRFDEFENAVGGKAGKRRERWHLYLQWLRDNPDLAAWRGGPAIVHALDSSAQARIAKAKPWRQRSVEAEEFWKANPELAALDRTHGAYEREFVRRRKTKRNPDGFEHRPTFTMPDPIHHPRWALFNAPQTSPSGYRALRLPSTRSGHGTVELCLLTGDRNADAWPSGWRCIRFRADPRLAQFSPRSEETIFRKGRNKGSVKTKLSYVFTDHQLGGIERPAQISGVKLILKDIRLNPDGSLRSATPYLVFACTIDDQPLTDRARAIQWAETGEITRAGKKRKARKLPVGLVTCAVDLGVRNLGFLTLARLGDDDHIHVIRSRNQWLDEVDANGRSAAGPDLAHIGSHKREIRRLRRLRGRPVKGERSHVRLQEHIDNMGSDRFKKAARAIVDFALNTSRAAPKGAMQPFPRADVLIVEKLAGFIPDAERERGINRALVAWNRGQLVLRLKEVARDAGLKLFEVHPAGTSQCCSKCGALGRRYSVARDDQTRALAIRFGWVEKLFACPNPDCPGRDPARPDRPFTCNADHNASLNLHRRFVLDDKAVAAFFAWKAHPSADRERLLRKIEDDLRPKLERMHGLSAVPIDTPF